MNASEQNHTAAMASLEPLSSVRERKAISFDDAQTATNFAVEKLRALEALEFSKVGNPTFVKGYLNRYGKELEIDVSEYLALFEQQRGEVGDASEQTEVQTTLVEYSSHPQKGRKSRLASIGFFRISAVIVLVWVGLFLLLSKPPESEKNHQVASANNAELNHQDTSLEVDQKSNTLSQPTQQSENLVESSDRLIAEVERDSPASNLEEEGSTLSSLNDSDLKDLASSVGEPSASNAVEDELVFQFIEDCWLKITDSDGKVLFADTRYKGDNLQLFGQAPFDILLGNARGVTLSLNGSPVEFSVQQHRRTLKFSVPN